MKQSSRDQGRGIIVRVMKWNHVTLSVTEKYNTEYSKIELTLGNHRQPSWGIKKVIVISLAQKWLTETGKIFSKVQATLTAIQWKQFTLKVRPQKKREKEKKRKIKSTIYADLENRHTTIRRRRRAYFFF